MNKIILLFISVWCFTSCGNFGQKSSAIEYNDAIVEQQNLIIEKMLSFSTAAQLNTASAERERKQLIEQCQKSIEVLKTMPDFQGDTELRDRGIDLFHYYKGIAENEFGEMLSIVAQDALDFTEEDFMRLEYLEHQISQNELPLDAGFQDAQQEFAKKHGLPLIPNKYQEIIDAQ
jgi:hypothetical protein